MDRDRQLDLESEPGNLETDRVLVRTMSQADAEAVSRIDERLTGRSRQEYFRRKIAAALADPGVRLSLVALLDKTAAGYLIASVDHGEFGVLAPVAVLDAVGVDPAFRQRRVASALLRQLTLQLQALRIERVRTEVDWRQWDLLRFLERVGFAPSPRLCLEARVDALPRS